MKKSYVSLLLLVGWQAIFAQEYFDILSFSYGLSPQTAFEQGDGRTQIQDLIFKADLPVPLSSSTTLLTGFNIRSNSIRLFDSISQHTRVSDYILPLGINQKLNPTWSTTILIMPKRVTALEVGRASWQIGGALLATKTLRTKLNYSFGFFANKEEYGVLFVPLAGMYYMSPSENFEISALLPSQARIDFRIRGNWHTGLAYDGFGSSYPVQIDNLGESYIQKMSTEISGYLRRDLTKSLLLSLRAGYALFRSYRLYEADDKIDFSIANIIFNDPRTVQNNPVSGGLLFKAELSYRFHFPKKQKPEN